MLKILGVLLILAGLAGLVRGGFSFTTREKVVDIGPIEATRDETHSVPIAPVAGVVAVASGIALLFVQRRAS